LTHKIALHTAKRPRLDEDEDDKDSSFESVESDEEDDEDKEVEEESFSDEQLPATPIKES
jgi:hypothetical protein